MKEELEKKLDNLIDLLDKDERIITINELKNKIGNDSMFL